MLGIQSGEKPENVNFLFFKSCKGRLIVARQFSGGKRYGTLRVRPVGTLESLSRHHLIQSSLRDVWGVGPSLPATELAGYYQPFLTGLNAMILPTISLADKPLAGYYQSFLPGLQKTRLPRRPEGAPHNNGMVKERPK